MTVIVKKLGGSVAVVIPKTVAREMELTEGMPLEMSANADGIILRKQRQRPRRPVDEIVAQISPGSYGRRSREVLEERAIGKEIW